MKSLRPLLLLLFVLLPGRLDAHEVRRAIATATIAENGSFSVELSLNLEAVMAGIGPDHTDTDDSAQAPTYDRLRSLNPEQLEAEFQTFARQFLAGTTRLMEARSSLRTHRVPGRSPRDGKCRRSLPPAAGW